ncbi:recombinase family protein [Actinoplanes regularis]|uniref:recombinase family protein n=1 Tax=Actinoplanes regularis TaxID=52697 RepID=UPI00249FF442|nr:hypothetical protein Areg01_34500 [Actinoplanes regularis]
MNGIRVGYVRCSTDEQDVIVQTEQLTALGVAPDRIYIDRAFSGTSRKNRAGLDRPSPPSGTKAWPSPNAKANSAAGNPSSPSPPDASSAPATPKAVCPLADLAEEYSVGRAPPSMATRRPTAGRNMDPLRPRRPDPDTAPTTAGPDLTAEPPTRRSYRSG